MPDTLPYPYAVRSIEQLAGLFGSEKFIRGITVSVPGFYGPQGRKLRLEPFDSEINKRLSEFTFRDRKICNYEMESSALYGLSALLGHKALTICAVIANRADGEFIADYKPLIRELAMNVFQII